MRRFRDRLEAGQDLARRLETLHLEPATLVLALPRGGVPVAAEVARTLALPLDVLCVRKLGAPGHEELALGAIAEGGGRVLNEDVIRQCKVSSRALEAIEARERRELERRASTYRAGRLALELGGRTVVIIDDGLATGATMRAAIAAARRAGALRVIVAVPVGPKDTLALLESEADEIVCLEVPEFFGAVGLWYEHFPQVTDDEVRDALARANDPAGNTRAPLENPQTR